MLLNQYPELNNFIDYLRFEKRYSQHTIISYQNDLQQFFTFLKSAFDSTSVSEISASMIRSWLAEMKENRYTAKSINRKISTLKSFFKFLCKQSIIKQSPVSTIVAPKNNKRLPSFINEKETDHLFNVISFSTDHVGKTEQLILSLFYSTGIRLSELINLKEEQLDANNCTIKVLGKGNKERIIPIHKNLLQQLILLQKNKPQNSIKNSFIFVNKKGLPLYPKYVYNLVKKYLSGVTTIERKSPHVLRHTFATHLMNNGANLNAVKELLGHASLASTQVYTHNTIENLKNIYKKAHPKA